MLFCAVCQSKSCAARMDQTPTFPKGCPGQGEKMDAWLQEYDEPFDRLMAQKSALCNQDYSECRLTKTMRFAQECGFHKLGLAFCDALDEQARQINAILCRNGFQVESIRCKVGHIDRSAIDAPSSQKAMCNPIAQAELLNEVGTEMNIIVGLCVGHDALFIRHSKAPVTVLATKDFVYDHAPLECLKDM